MYRISHYPFSFGESIFGEESSGPGFIDLSDRTHILQFEKEVPSAIKMLVCIVKFPNRKEQVTKIVFNPSEIPRIPRLLEMKTGGRVFHQGSVQIVFTVFRGGQSPENQSVLDVKTPFESMILTSLYQRGGLVIKAQGLL